MVMWGFYNLRNLTKRKKALVRVLCGDPDGIRTHDTAVKGRCLNHLTTGP